MKQKILMIVLAIVVIITGSCKDDGTGPGNEIKNPREFTWTADTIYYPDSYQTIIVSTWANNEKDIYAVGHTDVNEGQFWHYDGSKWSYIKIFDHIARGVLSFHKIWGISSNQIWIAGNRGGFGKEEPVVWLYNGTKIFETKLEGYHGKLTSIHGTGYNNIWACGDSGLVAHFDGSKWNIDKIKINIPGLAPLDLPDIVAIKDEAYVLCNTYPLKGMGVNRYFIKGKIGNWEIADSVHLEPYNPIEKWGSKHFYNSTWGTLYSHTHGLFKLTSNGWERITDFFNNNTPTWDLKGTSENNMIIVGDFSKAYHWNGTDVYQFLNLEKGNISSFDCVELFNDQSFVFGHTVSFPQKTIVYHGK